MKNRRKAYSRRFCRFAAAAVIISAMSIMAGAGEAGPENFISASEESFMEINRPAAAEEDISADFGSLGSAMKDPETGTETSRSGTGVSGEEAEASGNSKQASGTDLKIPGPEEDACGPDAEVSRGGTEFSGKDAETSGPDEEISEKSAEAGGSDAEIPEKSTEVYRSDTETSGTGTQAPGSDEETSGTGTQASEPDAGTSGTGTQAPGSDEETSGTGTQESGPDTEPFGVGTEDRGTDAEGPGTGAEDSTAGSETPKADTEDPVSPDPSEEDDETDETEETETIEITSIKWQYDELALEEAAAFTVWDGTDRSGGHLAAFGIPGEDPEAEPVALEISGVAVDPGIYTLSAGLRTGDMEKYRIGDGANTAFTLTIERRKILEVLFSGTQERIYNGTQQESPDTAGALGIDGSDAIAGSDALEDVLEVHLDPEGSGGKELFRDAGEYRFCAGIRTGKEAFYEFAGDADVQCRCIIRKRKVRLEPAKAYSKVFGEKDPEEFDYKVTDLDEESRPWEGEVSLHDDLRGETEGPSQVLLRDMTGEKPGEYHYLPGEYSDSYEVSAGEEQVFTIRKVKLDAEKTITSRTDSFQVRIENLHPAKADSRVEFRIKIKCTFPGENGKKDKIRFSADINDYIKNASKGIPLKEEKETVRIMEAEYTRKKKKEKYVWKGRLPAGSVLTLSLEGRRKDEKDWYVVSEKDRSVAVEKTPVSLHISSSADGSDSGTYLRAGDQLRITAGLAAAAGEYVRIGYRGRYTLGKLDQVIFPVSEDKGGVHREQTLSASFLDTLNLSFQEEVYSFIYDSQAFPVSSGAIRFENRGEKLLISLPEAGTLENVSIPGGRVKLPAGQGTEFELDVEWSGRKLISAGEQIHVEYTDRGGNRGSGKAVIVRSTVHTPISINLSPQLHNGYLSGKGVLVIYGEACSCETLKISVNGDLQTTTATVRDRWADEKGSWQVTYPMDHFRDGERITITADYADVNGPGAARAEALYDRYVPRAVLASPIFRMMSCFCGMAQPGSLVTLFIGERQFPIETDRFGFFVLTDAVRMMPGEGFILQTEDAAGNLSEMTGCIPDPGEEETAEGSIRMLGKMIYVPGYDGDKASDLFSVTPVETAGLKGGAMHVPMLFGMCYKAGEYLIEPAQGGLTVKMVPDPEIFTGSEGSVLSQEKLYVYRSRPGAEELVSHAGERYACGEVIPAEEGETIWIADEKTLKIQLPDIGKMKVYHFREPDGKERAAQPEVYEEYLTYVQYQEY